MLNLDSSSLSLCSYYLIAHALGEDIKVQPSILIGGDLKPYQLQVRVPGS